MVTVARRHRRRHGGGRRGRRGRPDRGRVHGHGRHEEERVHGHGRGGAGRRGGGGGHGCAIRRRDSSISASDAIRRDHGTYLPPRSMGSMRHPKSFPTSHWSPRHAVVATRYHGVTGGGSADVIVARRGSGAQWSCGRASGGSEKCGEW